MERKNYFECDSIYCSVCKGQCWDEEDNSKTQKNAREMFGITPNRCVNGSVDKYCPHSTSPRAVY